MQKQTAIFLFSMLLTGCAQNSNLSSITWNNDSKLPNTNNIEHLGVAGPITGIINRKLFIAGGANFPEGMPWDGGKKQYPETGYLYSIENGKLHFDKEFDFNLALAYPGNTTDGNLLYTAGGENENGPSNKVFSYELNDKNEVIHNELPNLPEPLTNAGLVYADHSLYLVGGENSSEVSDKIYKLDLNQNNASWKVFLTLPYPISTAVIVSDQKENIYIAGGRKRNENSKSTIYDQVLKLSLKDKSINTITKLKQATAAGTGIIYKGNLILFAGDNASTFHKVEQLIGEINLSKNEEEKKDLINKKNQIQSNHPGFTSEVWAFNLKEESWYSLDSITAASPVTTTALLYQDYVFIPSGEIKVGVRTNQILIGKLN